MKLFLNPAFFLVCSPIFHAVMRVSSYPCLVLAMTGLVVAQGGPPSVNLTISKEGGNRSSTLLYGIMFEVRRRWNLIYRSLLTLVISFRKWIIPVRSFGTLPKPMSLHSQGDGGIHGQILQNNGFQGADPGLTAYAPVGDALISQDASKPVSHAITSSLQVSVPAHATKYVGFANTGYNGVPVMAATYKSSFWMMGDYSGTINLQLIGSHSGIIYADHNLTVESKASKFTQYETSFNSSQSPDGDNELHLTFDGSKVADSALNFGLIQLFPPTYKGRYALHRCQKNQLC